MIALFTCLAKRSIHLSGKVMFYSPVWQGERAGEGAAAGLQAYGLAAAGLRYSLVQSGSTVEVKVVHYFTVGTMLTQKMFLDLNCYSDDMCKKVGFRHKSGFKKIVPTPKLLLD